MSALPPVLVELQAEYQQMIDDCCAWCGKEIKAHEQYVVYDKRTYCSLACVHELQEELKAIQYENTIADVEEERRQHMLYDGIQEIEISPSEY